ncbi:PKD domain-containing protein [bacterium]|nr:PKD domain-containing protein [bacterium]
MDTNQSSDNSVADFGTGGESNVSNKAATPNKAVAPNEVGGVPSTPDTPKVDAAVPRVEKVAQTPTSTQTPIPTSEQSSTPVSVTSPAQVQAVSTPEQPGMPKHATATTPTPTAPVSPSVTTPATTPAQADVLTSTPTPVSKQGVFTPAKPAKRKLTQDEIIQRDRARNKKVMLGCGGTFGVVAIILIILIFVFVGQGSNGTSALAQALNINQQSLIGTLSLIVNMFFGIGTFVLFIMSIGGIFKAMMARKDDRATKKRGYVMAGGAFGALVVIITMWIGAWMFLSAQQVPATVKPTGFVTQPESTFNLTAPVEITFDASTLPYDSSKYDIVSYLWDFGDGQAGPGSSKETHRYEKKGDGKYNVKLTLTFVRKDNGEESTDTITKLVTIADEKVVAVLDADTESGDAPLEISFDGSKSSDPDGTIKSYAWEVDGNGFKDGESTFKHTFDKVGVYTVKLRVTNQKGDFDIAEKEITVSAGKIPVASIDVLNADGGKFYVNKTYTFDASASSSPVGNLTSYEWDFGDGTSKVKSRTAQHSFSEGGTYKVLLTITDESGLTAKKEMEIKTEVAPSAPVAVMETDPAKKNTDDTSISGTVPFEVNFNATKSTDPDDDIVDYKWDFDGDGVFDGAGETASYTYNKVGSYNVSLTVIDSAGSESKDVLLVKAISRGLEPRLVAEPVSGVVPLTVEFDATGSTYEDGDIVSYEWDFGDGSAPRSDVGKVTYKYTKIGNFTVTVKVRTDDGKQKEATILISVRQVPLKSCFEFTKKVGDAPLTTTINPQCSTGTIAKYKWDFGDGESSTERKPTHVFTKPGSYEVTLEVSDAQNVVDVSSEFVTVTGELTE